MVDSDGRWLDFLIGPFKSYIVSFVPSYKALCTVQVRNQFYR